MGLYFVHWDVVEDDHENEKEEEEEQRERRRTRKMRQMGIMAGCRSVVGKHQHHLLQNDDGS